MKSTNYLIKNPRITREVDRVYHTGTIETAWDGLKLVCDDCCYLEIKMSDEELLELEKNLKRMRLAKKNKTFDFLNPISQK